MGNAIGVFQAGEACVFSTACFCGELCRGTVVQTAVRPALVVIAPPIGDDSSGLEQVLEPVNSQTFLAQLPVKTLHDTILRGLSGLDVNQIDLAIQCPGKEVATGQLRAIAPREA